MLRTVPGLSGSGGSPVGQANRGSAFRPCLHTAACNLLVRPRRTLAKPPAALPGQEVPAAALAGAQRRRRHSRPRGHSENPLHRSHRPPRDRRGDYRPGVPRRADSRRAMDRRLAVGEKGQQGTDLAAFCRLENRSLDSQRPSLPRQSPEALFPACRSVAGMAPASPGPACLGKPHNAFLGACVHGAGGLGRPCQAVADTRANYC
jgi:hypothetical protein